MTPHPRILIIDDVPDNIEVLGDAVASLGDVSFALSGPEGLQLIQAQHPDLVLLDVMMPGMNGYEVFATLQLDEDTADIPVIFVTAKNDPQSEASALDAGATDFISKPINPTVAKARVRMHLEHLARSREVRQLNAELEQRVTERTQALNDALIKSQAAQVAKANLLANMSHEFRTPLNAVLGMAYMASKRVSDAETAEMIRKISASGNRLLGLLSGILDLARIETQQLAIQKVPFNLQTVLLASVELAKPRALAKGLALELALAPSVPTDLVGDPVRIGNVLTNFIGNAIKFSTHGSIQVRVNAEGHIGDRFLLRLEVQDPGIGIAPEHQARIFELFEQLDASSTRAYGGVGMGLTICKMLVSMMGGTIGVVSAPGQGSTFWARIPLQASPTRLLQPEALNAERTQQLLEHLRALLSDDDFTAVAVWESARPMIEKALGPRAAAFAEAMDAFDLDQAKAQLVAAR